MSALDKMMEAYYPNFNRRVKAALVDSLLFSILMVSIIPILAGISAVPNWLRIILILSPFFILEPILVSYTGGSLGHHLFKIRIRRVDSERNISIIAATMRFILKTFLGLISLFFILFTKKHQAIHDFMAKSIVILKNPDDHAHNEVLKERIYDEIGFQNPSIIQRIIVPIFYNLVVYAIISMVFAFVGSDACIEDDVCSSTDELIVVILSAAWIVSVIYLFIAGLNGRLYGCRRKKITNQHNHLLR